MKLRSTSVVKFMILKQNKRVKKLSREYLESYNWSTDKLLLCKNKKNQ